MASLKITLWTITQILGWPITVMSMGGQLANMLGIPAATFELKEPYHSTVSILAIIFLITMICRSLMKVLDGWENWRHKKITNDQRMAEIRNKRQTNR